MTTQTATTANATRETCTPAQRVTKSLLGYGVLAGTVFEASILIQGLTRHGFRIAHDDASLLSNGPLGWIQIATFLVSGAMTIAFAVGTHRALAGRTGGRWGPRLITVYGTALMAAGLLRADPADGFGPGAPAGKAAHVSWHAAGHLISASIGFTALVPEPTIAQRIVRAKRTLAGQRVPFEIPVRSELPGRLASVLEVIYLLFNEGYSATTGEGWMRPALCAEAMRLGRILAGLMAGEGEVHGLVALMELQASRVGARTGPAGEPILLTGQDRRRWDRLLIRRGLQALERAGKPGRAPGPYEVQAEIAACHARAPSVQATDWERIAALYVVLGHLTRRRSSS